MGICDVGELMRKANALANDWAAELGPDYCIEVKERAWFKGAITAARLEVVERLREMALGRAALAIAASGGKFVVSEEYEADSLALSRAADQLEAEIRAAGEP